ncbi:hypothetical protein FNF31_06229 [Cafeteria roenbergensis]|uniref:Potassium channel domain-containing protein n=1 Tax=Cafeteria roenbergensis TaxID=33653 RepID=A0A5A8CRP1_CAFRO|nr:hypothetical protein FNF31_06229 [Cafeteria roenbergensis]
MRPPEASGEVAGEGADAATEKLSPRAGSGASDEDELSGTAFAPNAFRRLRDLEDRTVQIAAVMAILAVASIVLAIAEVELAVLRLPVTAALSLVGSCRAGRPSLLVRSGLAHTGLEGVLAYAPRVMPASPLGVLSVGNAADPAAVGGNASTAWALPLLNDQAPFCDPGAGSRLPPASENVTAGRPCSLDGNGMAAALLGIADRFAGKGASSLGPRAWALLLGSRRGCFDGLRSGTVSPGGGFLLPPARDTAAARGSAGTLEALGVGPTGMGVTGWPASSLEASERAVVLLPAPGALALERLAESIAAEFGGSAASLRLSALNDTARRVWAHALAAGGFPSGASLADGVATAASAQPSAALRRRALLAVEAATAESRRNSSAFGKPARSESRRGTLSDPWTRLRATAGQLQQAPGSACLWGPALAATAEALALAIHVPAGTWPELEAAVGPSAYVVVALAPICLRLPLLLRAAYLLSELSTGSGRLLVALSGQSFSFSFFVKTTLRQHAFACTVGIVVGAIAFTSVALHAAETLVCAASHVPACAPLSLPEAVYMTAISITTVGFGGRLTPRTTVGGGIVVLASFAALLATAVAVAQLVAFMQFDAAQDQVVALIRKASVRNARAALAAGAIQAAWHWSQEHRQSLLWTRGRASGVIYRSVASRASATLRATGAVARWAAFRAIAGRQLLDADMGPRRRVLAAFTLLRVDEARETARQALQLAADAEATVTAGISPQQAARVRSPSPDAVIAGGRLGMGWARSTGAQEDEVAAAFRAAAEQARALAARLSGRQHTPA